MNALGDSRFLCRSSTLRFKVNGRSATLTAWSLSSNFLQEWFRQIVENMWLVSLEIHTKFKPKNHLLFFFRALLCLKSTPTSRLSEDIHRNHCPPRAAEARPSQNLVNLGDGFTKRFWINLALTCQGVFKKFRSSICSINDFQKHSCLLPSSGKGWGWELCRPAVPPCWCPVDSAHPFSCNPHRAPHANRL